MRPSSVGEGWGCGYGSLGFKRWTSAHIRQHACTDMREGMRKGTETEGFVLDYSFM